jgi:Protein of unknown function (DUF3037)
MYSVVRLVPRPHTGESVNLGVVVTSKDGEDSDAQFTTLGRIPSRFRSAIDLRDVEGFVDGIRSRITASQLKLDRSESHLNPDILVDWYREFGGVMRVSEPRFVAGTDIRSVVESVFTDYVTIAVEAVREPVMALRFTHEVLLEHFDDWWKGATLSTSLKFSREPVRGSRAEHRLDRVLVEKGSGSLRGMAQAVSFDTQKLKNAYSERASVIVAAQDLKSKPRVRVFALLGGPTSNEHPEHADIFEQSKRLLKANNVIPIMPGNLGEIERELTEAMAH